MKKKFTIASAVLLSLILSVSLYGCGTQQKQEPTAPISSAVQSATESLPQSGDNEPTQQEITTQPQEESSSEREEKEETQPPQSQEEEPQDIPDLTGSWTPAAGESVASGSPANLAEIYGSGYAYGGSLDLNQNGTFFVGVGIINDNDAHKGTYSIDGASIYVSYNNGTSDTFTYISDYNGGEAVKARQGDYYIYFSR